MKWVILPMDIMVFLWGNMETRLMVRMEQMDTVWNTTRWGRLRSFLKDNVEIMCL